MTFDDLKIGVDIAPIIDHGRNVTKEDELMQVYLVFF